MINSRKKGFTLVELVIVIAVVAILAAVLIPTFSNLVKKANLSADQQAERQMNTLMASEFAVEKPEDLREVIDMLDENGYNVDALIPLSKGYFFAWNKDENKIELVLESELGNKVNLNEGASFINVDVNSYKNLKDAIQNGSDITLASDIVLESEIDIDSDHNIVIDLANHKITTKTYTDAGNIKHYYGFNNKGTLTIKNGTIEGRGGVKNYGELIIDSTVTINALDDNGGSCIWNQDTGIVTINGGIFNANNGGYIYNSEDYQLEPSLILNDGGKVTINGGTFTCTQSGCYGFINSGEMIINNCILTGYRGGIACSDGTVTINGGTYNKTGNTSSSHIVYAGGGNVNISAGSFVCEYIGTNSIKDFCESGGTITVSKDGNVKVNGVAYNE